MPRHDFRCPECGWLLLDQYRSAAEGAQAHPPQCFNCDRPMTWIPQAGFDLRSDSSDSDIPKFTTTDGFGNTVEIDSLHKLRQVEKESEQAYRNGEGQPMVFRAYANNRSNRDVGTLGEAPSAGLTPEGKRKFGRRGALKTMTDEPDHAYGPGVNDSNTSALK